MSPFPIRKVQTNETVLIIGSGIAGTMAAWLLSEAGYKVTVLERLKEPFDGTSRGVRAINAAGRYPWSWDTAIECLHSSILLKKLLPFAFSSELMRFLVVDTKNVHNPVKNVPPMSLEQYINFHTAIKDYYQSLPKRDQVLGKAKDLFRVMDKGELENFTNIVGGIESKESLFNIELVREFLLKQLSENKVEIKTQREVYSVKKRGSGWLIGCRSLADGSLSEHSSDIVINSAGYNSIFLSPELKRKKPDVALRLQLFTQLNIDKKTQQSYPFTCELVPGLIDYYTFKDGKATLLGYPTIIGKEELSKQGVWEVPQKWDDLMTSKQQRYEDEVEKLIKLAQTTFMPKLKFTSIESVRLGIATSFSHEPWKKTLLRLSQGHDGWYDLVPTKASHALNLALEISEAIVGATLKKRKYSLSKFISGIS